jgi:hypothetical protein
MAGILKELSPVRVPHSTTEWREVEGQLSGPNSLSGAEILHAYTSPV